MKIKVTDNADLINAAMELFRTAADRGAYKPALKRYCYNVLEWFRAEYLGRARRVWPKISVITYVLHRSGTTYNAAGTPSRRKMPVSNEAQLQAAARNALPLIDTGRTFATLIPGRPGNVIKIYNRHAVVGSTSPILRAAQQSRTVRFEFDADKYKQLKANVRERVGGKSNPFFRRMFLALRSMHGKSYTVPARPLPFGQPPKRLRDGLNRDIVATLVQAWRDAFNRVPRKRKQVK